MIETTGTTIGGLAAAVVKLRRELDRMIKAYAGQIENNGSYGRALAGARGILEKTKEWA